MPDRSPRSPRPREATGHLRVPVGSSRRSASGLPTLTAVATPATLAAPIGTVIQDTPSADRIIHLYNRVKGHVPVRLRHPLDEAAFRRAYGAGDLTNLGRQLWRWFTARSRAPQAPKGVGGEPVSIFREVRFDPNSQLHKDLVAVEEAHRYLRVKGQDVMAHNPKAAQHIRNMQNAFEGAVPGMVQDAGMTDGWVKMVDEDSAVVFHNGTVLRNFLHTR
jgi:hypothetical protein